MSVLDNNNITIDDNNDIWSGEYIPISNEIHTMSNDDYIRYLDWMNIKETTQPFSSLLILTGANCSIDFLDASAQSTLMLGGQEIQALTLKGINLSKQMLVKADTINPENASFIACTLNDANFINVENPRLKMDLIKRFRHVFEKQRYFREAEILQHEELLLQAKQMKTWKKYLSSEYFIILFSDYFSDFGKSLWRPFRLLLFIALFFFLMTHCSGYLGKYSFSLSGEWLLSDFLADMFSAIIALPNLHDLKDPELFATGWAKFWNIILFIIIKFLTGYLLYNFIRATRRYNK
jgi:hypothetical protein